MQKRFCPLPEQIVVHVVPASACEIGKAIAASSASVESISKNVFILPSLISMPHLTFCWPLVKPHILWQKD